MGGSAVDGVFDISLPHPHRGFLASYRTSHKTEGSQYSHNIKICQVKIHNSTQIEILSMAIIMLVGDGVVMLLLVVVVMVVMVVVVALV